MIDIKNEEIRREREKNIKVNKYQKSKNQAGKPIDGMKKERKKDARNEEKGRHCQEIGAWEW